MSPSPPPPSPRRRRLQDGSGSHTDKLQIRVVPYSPPRLSSEISTADSSRPVSRDRSRSPTVGPSSGAVSIPSGPVESDALSVSSNWSRVRDQSEPPSSPLVSPLRPSSSHTAPVESPRAGSWQTDELRAPPQDPRHSQGSPSSLATPPSLRRSKNIISVHSDKTFSLIPHSTSTSTRTESMKSQPLSTTTPSSSYGRSSDAFTIEDGGSSSPLTPLAERTSPLSSPTPSKGPPPLSEPASPVVSAPVSPAAPTPSPAASTLAPAPALTPRAADPAPLPSPASPWNYDFVGGVRKVSKTLQAGEGRRLSASSLSSTDLDQSQLPSLRDIGRSVSGSAPVPPLGTKTSFQSSASDSTLSDRTNYKIYGQSSPVAAAASAASDDPAGYSLDSLPPSPVRPNYQILADSSSSDLSLDEQPRPQTGESDANYVLHGDQSASSTSLVPTRSPLRPEYSQESLLVPPLRPARKRSWERSAISKSRSRDSIRRGSLTSLSSVLSQEATRAVFAGAATINIPPRFQRQNSSVSTASQQSPQMIASHPHQWSSQLSTVPSESEGGSVPPTRSISPLSGSGRNSSGFNSTHSRQMLSISSSLAGFEDATGQAADSRSGSLDRPQPTLSRNVSRDPAMGSQLLIRDHDEDGDGLADLQELHHRSSRTRMASYTPDRNLWSSSSSRTNSLSNSAIPLWARLYYGSGERRILLAQPSSESMVSLYNNGHVGNSFLNRSPSTERFTAAIFNPRRRPREPSSTQARPQTQESEARSLEISQNRIMSIPRVVKKQTSSIWSPHLRSDRRASRYSLWEPPSAVWSAQGGLTSRRNVQIVLFVLGFVFPFAWMFAAFLPLPPNPQPDMAERLHSTSHLNLQLEAARHMHAAQESTHHSAKWWRTLNRGMSVIGLILICIAIALIVVGVKTQWRH